MTSARQGDLFGADPSAPFDEDAPTPVYRVDPHEVRAELYRILAERGRRRRYRGSQSRFRFI